MRTFVWIIKPFLSRLGPGRSKQDRVPCRLGKSTHSSYERKNPHTTLRTPEFRCNSATLLLLCWAYTTAHLHRTAYVVPCTCVQAPTWRGVPETRRQQSDNFRVPLVSTNPNLPTPGTPKSIGGVYTTHYLEPPLFLRDPPPQAQRNPKCIGGVLELHNILAVCY